MAEHCLAEIRAVMPEEWRDVKLTACVLRLNKLAEIAEREKRRAYDAWDAARAGKLSEPEIVAIGNAVRAALADDSDKRGIEQIVRDALSLPNVPDQERALPNGEK